MSRLALNLADPKKCITGAISVMIINDTKNIRDQIESYIVNNGNFVKSSEQPLFVRIEKFSDSSIDLLIYCFVTTKAWGEWLAIKEELALEVKNIVENNKAGFAFPSQSIYIEKN